MKLKRVYFDSNAFDALLEDEEARAAFLSMRAQKVAALSFSPINLDELYSMACEPSGRMKANDILDMATQISWGTLLKEPNQLLDEAGLEVLGVEKLKTPFLGENGGCSNRLEEVISRTKALSDHEVRDAAREIMSKEKEGRVVFRNIRDQVRASIQARGDAGTRISFEDFRSRNMVDRLITMQVARPLSKLRDRKKAMTKGHPLLLRIADIQLYRVWVELVRGTSISASAKYGPKDMQQATYLPFVHFFVTEDAKFRAALGAVAGRKERVVNYSEFRRWCVSAS